MAYRNRRNNKGSARGTGSWFGDIIYDPRPPNPESQGHGSSNVSLTVSTLDGEYMCSTLKGYVEKSSIIQDLDNSDGFIRLASFSKSKAALTVHDAKVIVVKNISNIACEVAFTTHDWRNDSGGTTVDVQNSLDANEEDGTGEETVRRTWSMILPANDFIYLPTSRFIGYQPLNTDGLGVLESGANSPAGAVAIEPKDINSGNEYKKVSLFAGSTYASGNDVLVNGTISSSTTTSLVVDDGDWFEVGDLLIIGNTPSEVVEVEAISGTTLTIKRAMLGSTAGDITNDHEINYFFGNRYLRFDSGKCQTDPQGRFHMTGAYFGFGRSADKVASGVTPGTIAIGPFYTRGGYLDWGLDNVKATDDTGLAASTTYTFHIVVDEFHINGFDSVGSEKAIAFTTDASDTTFAGSGLAVLPKIQAVLDAEFYDASSGLKNKKVTISIVNGDVRIRSLSNHSETRIGIGNVSGTTPFGVGRFPLLGDGSNGASNGVPVVKGAEFGGGTTDTISFGPASSLDLEEVETKITGKTIKNTSAFIYDDARGNLMHDGAIVGWVDYKKGHLEFQTTAFPNAEFKVYGETLCSHSGGVNWSNNAQNTLYSIDARSLNTKQDSKVEVLLLG